jgi:hypothetical protein
LTLVGGVFVVVPLSIFIPKSFDETVYAAFQLFFLSALFYILKDDYRVELGFRLRYYLGRFRKNFPRALRWGLLFAVATPAPQFR